MGAKKTLTTSRKLEKLSKPKVPRIKKPKPPQPPKGDIGTKTAHAKWPAMYKRHLGMIESHIRTLDRVMQSMRANMDAMGEKERGEWERGERGNWGVICGMMNRAVGALGDARAGGEGILPERFLKEKKVASMGPIAAAYTGPTVRPKGGEPTFEDFLGPAEADADSASNSDSDSEGESDDEEGTAPDDMLVDEGRSIPSHTRTTASPSPAPAPTAAFIPLTVGKKRKLSVDVEEEKGTGDSNPYFMVDTNPTPVPQPTHTEKASKKAKKKHGDGSGVEDVDGGKKSKKRARDEGEDGEENISKVEDKDGERVGEVDFEEVERQLRDEVQKGMDAKEARRKEKKESKERKRKRISEGSAGAEVVIKKSKKERRKSDGGEGEDAAVESGKKEKKKKRKHGEE